MLNRIQAVLPGNEQLFEQLVVKLETDAEQTLPEVLQKKLDTIKNNPIDEKTLSDKRDEINKLVVSGELDKDDALMDILEAIYSIEEIEKMQELHSIVIKDLVHFAGEVSKKVFLIKEINELGEEVLKEVPSQNELQPITYGVSKLLRSETKKYNRLLAKIGESVRKTGESSDKDELDKQDKMFTKSDEALEVLKALTHKHSGLETSSMSEWELELLYNKMLAMAYGNYTPPLGKK